MSILPISKEDLREEMDIEEKEELKLTIEEPIKEREEESEGEEEDQPTAEKELFEKPKKKKVIDVEVPPKEISKKTGKPKRKMSEAQLNNLAKAREKSKLARQRAKEAKDVEKVIKKKERSAKVEAKLLEKEKAEALLEYKAEIQMQAQQNATWSDERLQKLMFNTIDNYMEKRRIDKATPKAKVTIPNQNYNPNVPQYQQSGYNQPNIIPQQNYNHGRHHQQPQHQPPPSNGRSNHYNSTMNNLFGFTE